MADIFISYRRDGADKGRALHIAQDLRAAFGDDAVFLDEQADALGRVSSLLSPELYTCRALIVVIGKQWMKQCQDLSRRNDWVHAEIETALGRDILIVPVLIDGESMPEASQLPQSLEGFCAYRERPLHAQHWKEDVDKLIDGLANTLHLRRKSVVGDVPNLSGNWIDTDGVPVKLVHHGDEVKIYLMPGGTMMGQGDATLDGNRVRFTIWRADLGNGTGTGTVSPDGRQISGSIQYGFQQYGFSISRR